MCAKRLVFNPLDPQYLADPYPTLAALRESDPVHRWLLGRWTTARYPTSSRLGDWLFTRHEHVEALLKDRRLGKWKPRLDLQRETSVEPVVRSQTLWMGLRDPPYHTPFKKLFAQYLGLSRIRTLVPLIEQLAATLIDEYRPQGGMDLIADFADQLASRVLAALIGVDAERWRELVRLAERPMQLFDGTPLAGAARAEANADLQTLNAHLRALGKGVAGAGREGEAGLLQALRAIPSPDPAAADDEVFEAQLVLLIYAGHGTMRDLIGNTLLCLHREPETLAAVRADPTLAGDAVEETLRYESPACVDQRTVHEAFDLAGITLQEGQTISLSISSANRDRRVFGANADEFHLERPARAASLAFGGGIHYCSGWALGKVQAEAALRVVLERLPALQLPSLAQPDWRPSIALRGLNSLPARW